MGVGSLYSLHSVRRQYSYGHSGISQSPISPLPHMLLQAFQPRLSEEVQCMALTLSHWIYLLVVLLVIAGMAMRRGVIRCAF